MTLLEIKSVNFNADNKKVLNDFNLSIKAGEVYCLIGTNGAGKTTLANIIMGVVKAESGVLLFKNVDISRLSITERAKMGITLAWQKPATIEGLSINDYIKLGKKGSTDADVRKAFESVGLEYDEFSARILDDKLSGGERKRIELASVVNMDSKLVILDEPDSGIDMVNMQFIKKFISKLKELGKSVLLITHKEDMILLADKAGILCAGKIIREGEPKKVSDYFKNGCRVCKDFTGENCEK
ncbi:putative branched-chain amino acid transport ATP-binding protein LivG [Candidatus Tiddalikarchaeum anstoanum]|nr:putative branched-chain amino acid transport ATP-binding protein LivG [Candidatus Tiddalikarchaeum anstoanum]